MIAGKTKGFRETLIFVTGMTPQIITETIYGLIHKKPPIYPDEIYILTTSNGASMLRQSLFNSGIFDNFCKEFKLNKNIFKDDSIIVIKDNKGKVLTDIVNERDNECAGDFICSFIKEKAKDETRRLHCSIAGGRKTMSFYMGSALQLFGRSWDRLYHVLVSPEFESHSEFFYKPKKNRLLKKDGISLKTNDAWIYLADLPFIRLGDKVSFNKKGFRELVKEGQKEIDSAMIQHDLIVKRQERSLHIGNRNIKLTPFNMMIYIAYLRYKLDRCRYTPRPYCFDCTDCFPSIVELSTKPALEEMAKDYMVIAPSKVDDLLYKHKNGLSMDILRTAISKIKKTIYDEIKDETVASCYAITTSRRDYANTRHGIRIEKGKIRIE
jgi:CRISPR-associated protein Csx14